MSNAACLSSEYVLISGFNYRVLNVQRHTLLLVSCFLRLLLKEKWNVARSGMYRYYDVLTMTRITKMWLSWVTKYKSIEKGSLKTQCSTEYVFNNNDKYKWYEVKTTKTLNCKYEEVPKSKGNCAAVGKESGGTHCSARWPLLLCLLS